MNDLKQKIKSTALFTLEEKVEILAALGTFSQEDLRGLESIVDEYDAKYRQIVSTFRHNLLDELDSIQKKTRPNKSGQLKEAIDKIRVGLAAVTNV